MIHSYCPYAQFIEYRSGLLRKFVVKIVLVMIKK